MKLNRLFWKFSSIVAVNAISCAGFAQTSQIKVTPFFNTPGFESQATSTVEDKFLEGINTAVPGSKINVAMMMLTRRIVSESLVLAAERGVDVQLVLDGQNLRYRPGDAIDVVLNGFSEHKGIDSCTEKPCVKFCHGPLEILKIGHGRVGGSCHGLSINHNKFMIFSELAGGDKYVIMQSSANIEEEHLHRYNDLVEVVNDKKLYEGYLNYWEGIKRDHTRLTSPGDFVGDSGIIVRTSPRLIGHDPVADLLKRVRCDLPGSVIRAAESDLGRVGVAKQLAKLRDAGCVVKVFALDDPELHQPGKKVRQLLGANLVLVKKQWKQSELPLNSIHTKMLLIDAALDKDAFKSKILLTGSQNLDLFSLKGNDECQMELHDPLIFEQYLGFWERILRDAKISGLVEAFTDDISQLPDDDNGPF